jgi:hypothetical protein
MGAMKARIHLEILPQPDEITCGPTCLHAVYNFYGEDLSLEEVIREVRTLEGGGTLAVFLACHALRRGYHARIYTYNLHVFDPVWFVPGAPDIRERLIAQMEAKAEPKLHTATRGYLEFLKLGGELRFEDLTTRLIRKYLKRSIPILTGLSSTYLYRSPREYGEEGEGEEDDVKGEPAGHFVLLCGYDREERQVLIADPFLPNPVSDTQYYVVSIDRVLCAILLGILTHDANFLILTPKKGPRG